MNAPDFKTEAQAGTLIRPSENSGSFPGLERIGDKFARGLRQVIAGLGGNEALVTRAQTQIMTYGALKIDHAGLGGYVRFRIDMIKGGAMLILPPALVRQLVDIFYGGPGDLSDAPDDFTSAETRFVDRIAQQCLPLFKAAWADVAPITTSFAGFATDIDSAVFAKDHDLVAVQSFVIGGGPFSETTIKCVYSTLGIRVFPALSKTSQPKVSETADPVWLEKLTDALMQVHLPVRSIFVRPELPLAKLLTLQAGDIIPVCLPRHLPLTVAGRLYAHGTAGESCGRAAIRIEKMEEGSNQDE